MLLSTTLQLFFMFDRSDSVEGDYNFQFMGEVRICVRVTCVGVTCVIDPSLVALFVFSVRL